MASRRTYRNPPIEEALVEFRFAPTSEWNITVPGRLYEAMRKTYPAEPQEQRVLQAGLRVDEGGAAATALQVGDQGTKVLLRSADERRLVGVGRGVLSVHNLRPYGGWDEDFRPRILAAMDAYLGVVETPPAVVRIGLRYINHVTIASSRVALEDYFKVGFEVPDEFSPDVSSFFVRVESELDGDTHLATTFASTTAPIGESAFLLDLDLFVDNSKSAIALNEILPAVDSLRDKERAAFEAMLTEPVRELFDA